MSSTGSCPLLEDVFCFWTLKGGVGKTTMCFHSATAYAEMYPEKQVIIVDCDPQANLSATILTQLYCDWNPDVVRQDKEGLDVVDEMANHILHEHFPKTLLGYFMSLYASGVNPLKPNEVLIDAHKHNSNLPKNIRLLCGDLRLRCAEDYIRENVQGKFALPMGPAPWVIERLRLLDFIKAAAVESNKQTVVFIDTNPALDIFTEIALLTANKLIVPVNSDHYSTAALRKVLYNLHGIGSSKAAAIKEFEKTMFWSKAQQHKCKVAKIHTVMFNKCSTHSQSLTQAQNGIWEKQCEVLNGLLEDIRKSGLDVKDVFDFGTSRRVPKTASAVGNMFGCHMTDMLSAGIICMSCGLPLWMLRRNRVAVCKKMAMKHTAVSKLSDRDIQSHNATLLQLVGDIKHIEKTYTIDDNEATMKPVLFALMRGSKKIPLRAIKRTLMEADINAKNAYGPKMKIPKAGGSAETVDDDGDDADS